jgi:hypothetical protein
MIRFLPLALSGFLLAGCAVPLIQAAAPQLLPGAKDVVSRLADAVPPKP